MQPHDKHCLFCWLSAPCKEVSFNYSPVQTRSNGMTLTWSVQPLSSSVQGEGRQCSPACSPEISEYQTIHITLHHSDEVKENWAGFAVISMFDIFWNVYLHVLLSCSKHGSHVDRSRGLGVDCLQK